MPAAVGVPLIVIVLLPKLAVTPAGKLVGVPMPVAPVVVCVIFGDKAVLIHSVGVDEAAPAVLFAITVPLADTLILFPTANPPPETLIFSLL